MWTRVRVHQGPTTCSPARGRTSTRARAHRCTRALVHSTCVPSAYNMRIIITPSTRRFISAHQVHTNSIRRTATRMDRMRTTRALDAYNERSQARHCERLHRVSDFTTSLQACTGTTRYDPTTHALQTNTIRCAKRHGLARKKERDTKEQSEEETGREGSQRVEWSEKGL